MTDFKLTLTWKQCVCLAKYYEFPPSVLLLQEKDMLEKMKGHRKDSIVNQIWQLKRLKEEIRELLE